MLRASGTFPWGSYLPAQRAAVRRYSGRQEVKVSGKMWQSWPVHSSVVGVLWPERVGQPWALNQTLDVLAYRCLQPGLWSGGGQHAVWEVGGGACRQISENSSVLAWNWRGGACGCVIRAPGGVRRCLSGWLNSSRWQAPSSHLTCAFWFLEYQPGSLM